MTTRHTAVILPSPRRQIYTTRAAKAHVVAEHEYSKEQPGEGSRKNNPRKRRQEEVKGERRSKRLRKESPGEEENTAESQADRAGERRTVTLGRTPRQEELPKESQQEELSEKRKTTLGRTPRAPATARAKKLGVLLSDSDDKDITPSQLKGRKFMLTRLSETRIKIKGPVNLKVQYTKDYFSNNEKVKFGDRPYVSFVGPTPDLANEVFDALSAFHLQDPVDPPKFRRVIPRQPGHAYKGDIFHAIVKPLLSQRTTNDTMLVSIDTLFLGLTYSQDGKQVVSKISPNYHAIAGMSKSKLVNILRPGGYYNLRAKYLIDIIAAISERNRRRFGDRADEIEREALSAPDWVDGLLSLDFLRGLSKQQVFDELVSLRGVGSKTAACIMCFAYNWAVFAVDTHVHRLTMWLSWVPWGCTADEAFRALDAVIPGEIKRDLHQAFWQHALRCIRCRGTSSEKTPGWYDCICPLEQFGIVRHPLPEPDKAVTVNGKKSTEKSPTKPKLKAEPGFTRLNTEEEVQAAIKAGYTVHRIPVDDAFVGEVAASNIKAQYLVYCLPLDGIAFRFTKTKTLRKTKTTKTTTEVIDEILVQETLTKEIITKEETTTKTKALVTMG